MRPTSSSCGTASITWKASGSAICSRSNGLVSDDVIKASSPTLLSRFGGKTYRARLVSAADDLDLQQGSLSTRRALMPTRRRKTWDEFLAACDKLKSAGIAPVGGGIQDGYWGEWYFGHALGAECRQRRRSHRPVHRRARFPRSEVSRALGEARGAEEGGLPQCRDVLDRTLSGHRPDRRRQGGAGSFDWRAVARRQQDDERPDRHHGHAGLWQGQARRQADLRFPGSWHSRQGEGSEGRRGVPRISAIAGAAEGAS